MVTISNPSNHTFNLAVANFDTGVDANLISREVVQRMGLDYLVQESTSPEMLMGLGGSTVCLDYSIELIIAVEHTSRTFSVLCYVLDSVPFDLILGKSFIMENLDDLLT
jgi:hypothetical protein